MIELITAINASVAAMPALTTGLTGGFHLQHAPQGTTLPFVVLVPLTAPPEFNTSKTYVQPVGMQFSFFCKNITDVAALIKAYRDEFTYQPLALGAGRVMTAELTDERVFDDQDDENEAFHCKHYVLEFKFTQLQAHA